MKLVDLTCTGCGANVKVDPSLKVANCTVCGKQMLIEHSGEFGAGYDREMGRIQAQREVEEQWKAEREENLRLVAQAEKERRQKKEMDRIKKQLRKICVAEGIICILLFISTFVLPGEGGNAWIRIPTSFIQLALIAAVTLFFSKDRYFGQIILACLICAVLSIACSFYAKAIVFYVVFNIIKLIWMIRVERVKYSWQEIVSSVKPKK
ncbi:MAG: hypothetical protein J6Y08_02690 [Clostridiales bacterium]|nr:hypothetical protein [Clostridiales bacterium]